MSKNSIIEKSFHIPCIILRICATQTLHSNKAKEREQKELYKKQLRTAHRIKMPFQSSPVCVCAL